MKKTTISAYHQGSLNDAFSRIKQLRDEASRKMTEAEQLREKAAAIAERNKAERKALLLGFVTTAGYSSAGELIAELRGIDRNRKSSFTQIKRPRVTPERRNQIISLLHRPGIEIQEVAKNVGVSTATVYKIRNQSGLKVAA